MFGSFENLGGFKILSVLAIWQFLLFSNFEHIGWPIWQLLRYLNNLFHFEILTILAIWTILDNLGTLTILGHFNKVGPLQNFIHFG